jgi:hypothetical protein
LQTAAEQIPADKFDMILPMHPVNRKLRLVGEVFQSRAELTDNEDTFACQLVPVFG